MLKDTQGAQVVVVVQVFVALVVRVKALEGLTQHHQRQIAEQVVAADLVLLAVEPYQVLELQVGWIFFTKIFRSVNNNRRK